MKLILCEKCSDIFSLRANQRVCACGESGGRYVDGLNAEVWGPCFKIGFNNHSLVSALRAQKFEGDSQERMLYDGGMATKGRTFEAFIIPESAKTMIRVENTNEQT